MVLVLKKEVVKTNNSVEHDDVGKYRQLLVRTLHQCTVKFPDVANTIIPVVSKHIHGRARHWIRRYNTFLSLVDVFCCRVLLC